VAFERQVIDPDRFRRVLGHVPTSVTIVAGLVAQGRVGGVLAAGGSGGSSITMFGGSGNDSLASSGGTWPSALSCSTRSCRI